MAMSVWFTVWQIFRSECKPKNIGILNVINLVKLINAMKITSDCSKVIFNGF